MRRLLWWALVVGVAVLPLVVVVGHPVWLSLTTHGRGFTPTVRQSMDSLRMPIQFRQGEGMYQVVHAFAEWDEPALGRSRPGVGDPTLLPTWEKWERAGEPLSWSPSAELVQSALGPNSSVNSFQPGRGPLLDSVLTLGYGWPRVSLAADYIEPMNFSANYPAQCTVFLGIGVGGDTVSGDFAELPRAIPTRVVWRGLLFNTLVFGIPIWIVGTMHIVLLGMLLRARRWARRLCGRCRYQMGTLGTCPECGTRRPGVA